MNSTAKTVTWAGIGAALALIAANGTQLLEVVTGAWLFLVKISETAPLGVGSFALALSLGMASRPFLVRYLPPMRREPTLREFLIDVSALAIGVGVMFGQLRTLNGALLGLLAGFAAPLVARAIGAMWGLWINRESSP